MPQDQVSSYGVVGVGERKGQSLRITGMVEKPKPAEAPSNLIITGRYILQPEIFDLLADQQTGAGGEIQVTDAILRLLKTQPGYAFQFEGRTFDCGSKLGFLSANVAYALAQPDIAPELRPVLKRLDGLVLQPHAEQEHRRRIVDVRHGRVQPFLPDLALDLRHAVELVGERARTPNSGCPCAPNRHSRRGRS